MAKKKKQQIPIPR